MTDDVYWADRLCPDCMGTPRGCATCDDRGWIPLSVEDAAAMGAVPRPTEGAKKAWEL